MKPKKYLGQHFLTAPAFAERIAAAVPAAGGESVAEIGPGRGALTVHLIKRFPQLHLIEVDKDAIDILKGKLGAANCVIHNENILNFDLSKTGFPTHAVGNLPYNIGAPIIKKCLLCSPKILSCTFMVQREVAERVVSEPHCKDNGWLTIFCQFFGEAKILFRVPPGAFFPRPNVESSVFQIIVDKDVEKKLERGRWADFFSFVDTGFSMRRKQLAKTLSLKYGHDKDFYVKTFSEIDIDPTARPEDLGIDDWLRFYKKTAAGHGFPPTLPPSS